MANSIKKNFLFFSKDGFTYDKSNRLTNNMQLLGSGIGKNLSEAFKDFKKNQKKDTKQEEKKEEKEEKFTAREKEFLYKKKLRTKADILLEK